MEVVMSTQTHELDRIFSEALEASMQANNPADRLKAQAVMDIITLAKTAFAGSGMASVALAARVLATEDPELRPHIGDALRWISLGFAGF